MRIKLQKLRQGTKYQSYRIAIPKSIIESKHWENANLELIDKNEVLELRKSK